jgi:hypothetical protein
MRNNFHRIVAGINGGFEYLDLLTGKIGPFQSSDQLFGFPRKHRSADDLNPASPFRMIDCILEKHGFGKFSWELKAWGLKS